MIESAMKTADPLPSATVALARNGADGPELLLVLRHSRASFGDSYVFPGGLVEAQDHEVTGLCRGPGAAAADKLLGVDQGGLAYYSAAIRELFEEAGVLLARDPTGRFADAAPLQPYRSALNSGEERWPEFLARYGLTLACDALNYFAYWITPREIRKRFSTRFFVAAMPDGQTASHCGTELTDSCWLRAEDALARGGSPGFRLPHPTRVSLETLGPFSSVDAMLDWAKQQGRQGVDCNLPAVVSVKGTPTVVMPDDQLYPAYGQDDE